MRILLSLAVVAACTDAAPPANTVAFELSVPGGFWDLPFPSDLRLTADGRPDLSAFPNKRNLPVVNDLLSVAAERRGFPVMPITWFRFTQDAPVTALDHVTSDALLVDVDPSSTARGTLYPVVAQTMPDDAYTEHGLVAIAPRPGIVLHGGTRYAVVLKTSFAPGVAVPPQFAQLAAGRGPDAATQLYAPLWDTLDALGIARGDVLVATVFTTGDEVALLRARSEAIRAAHQATIQDLHVVQAHATFCDIAGTVTYPQFQVGTQPFDRAGRFALDATGTPIVQGAMTVPLHITLPAAPMPAAGWPLWQFFHGSGGASFDIVDDGPALTSEDITTPGEGPGYVVAARGIATAASALPLNPERLPNASNYAYLNLNNLAAFPYTFQQGVFEQRMFLDALLATQVPTCDGGTAHFDATKLAAGGHSMGGMYANLIGAVEPRFGAITAFGAGGLWNMMILETSIVNDSRDLIAGVLGVDPATLDFTHPAISLIDLGWEIAEPLPAMAHLARQPLPGLPARHVYEPIGMDDKFFANDVFDAAALAYGNREAGDQVWPGTQDALRVDHLDGMMAYPVRGNRDGTTNVVVQYHDDGIVDAHYIHRQLPAVKYQYGCFLATYLRDGTPTVFAPNADMFAACP